MISRIAFRDSLKSLGDYAVYFVTLTLAIAIFYAFTSAYPQALALVGSAISETRISALSCLREGLQIASFFVALMFTFLILYASNFFYKRKQKQYGLFSILGFPRGKIVFIATLEALIPSLASLVAGLVVGVGISQLLGLFTTSMFAAGKTSFSFFFSFDGFWKTAAFFAILILISSLLNLWKLSHGSSLMVYSGGHKNEVAILLKKKKTVIGMLIVSLLLLLLSYALMVLYFIETSPIVFITGSLSAFLFFSSFSYLLWSKAKKHKKHYYSHLNFFVIKKASSHINSNSWTLAFVSLVLILTTFLMAIGFGINFGYEGDEAFLFGFSYIALYMGVSFAMSACAVMAIHSLSGAMDEKEQYAFLLTIGADRAQVNRTLFKEQAFYFLYPLAFAAVAVAIGLVGASSEIYRVLSCHIEFGILISLAIILGLYGGYFVLTYFLSRRMVYKGLASVRR